MKTIFFAAIVATVAGCTTTVTSNLERDPALAEIHEIDKRHNTAVAIQNEAKAGGMLLTESMACSKNNLEVRAQAREALAAEAARDAMRANRTIIQLPRDQSVTEAAFGICQAMRAAQSGELQQ